MNFSILPNTNPISIYSTQIETHGSDQKKWISCPLVEPHASIILGHHYYKSTRIIICETLHQFSQIQYDSEMIVEYESMTNRNKLFVCFFIQYDASAEIAVVDKILDLVDFDATQTRESTEWFPVEFKSGIMYVDNVINHVLVCSTPILSANTKIKKGVLGRCSLPLFLTKPLAKNIHKIYNREFTIEVEDMDEISEYVNGEEGFANSNSNSNKKKKKQQPLVETTTVGTVDDDYVQCTPVLADGEDVQTYSLPIGSTAVENQQLNTNMTFAIAIVFILVLLLSMVFGLPHFYTWMNKLLSGNVNRVSILYTITILFGLALVCGGIMLLLFNPKQLGYVGIIFFAVFVVFVLVWLLHPTIRSHFVNTSNDSPNAGFGTSLMAILAKVYEKLHWYGILALVFAFLLLISVLIASCPGSGYSFTIFLFLFLLSLTIAVIYIISLSGNQSP